MENLPGDTLHLIVDHLYIRSIGRLSLTCRRLYDVVHSHKEIAGGLRIMSAAYQGGHQDIPTLYRCALAMAAVLDVWIPIPLGKLKIQGIVCLAAAVGNKCWLQRWLSLHRFCLPADCELIADVEELCLADVRTRLWTFCKRFGVLFPNAARPFFPTVAKPDLWKEPVEYLAARSGVLENLQALLYAKAATCHITDHVNSPNIIERVGLQWVEAAVRGAIAGEQLIVLGYINMHSAILELSEVLCWFDYYDRGESLEFASSIICQRFSFSNAQMSNLVHFLLENNRQHRIVLWERFCGEAVYTQLLIAQQQKSMNLYRRTAKELLAKGHLQAVYNSLVTIRNSIKDFIQ